VPIKRARAVNGEPKRKGGGGGESFPPFFASAGFLSPKNKYKKGRITEKRAKKPSEKEVGSRGCFFMHHDSPYHASLMEKIKIKIKKLSHNS
jgi:hypothetical protein